MSQFDVLLPDHNLRESLKITRSKNTSQQNFCACCLSQIAPLISLSSCKHAHFLSRIFENKVDFSNLHICLLCHSIIKKIDKFIRQIEECSAILKGASQKLNYGIHNLHNSKIEICSIVNGDFILSDIKLEPELKVEDDSDYDMEIDIPLIQMKKNMGTKKKKKQKENLKKRSALKEEYKGKIKLVILNREELMEERRKDALKESYLNLPYKCENCIIGFDHEVTLKVHMEQRHSQNKGGFTCSICKSVWSSEFSLKEHNKRHVKRYECEVCGKRNNDVHSVVKHYKDQHGPISTLFTCRECGFTTESNRIYRYHRDKHKGKVQCNECGNTFVNATGLRVHMLTFHGQSEREYPCSVCGKRYRAKSSLTAHRSSHAARAAPDTFCAPCATHFRSPLGLRHHLRTHSRHVRDCDKRFICDDCGKKFLTKTSLQEHIDWVHLKKAKHECNKCSKVFKNGSALKKHKNYVHEKKRPPRNKICDHCGRGFTTLSILRSHVRTHTGERPLRCAKCQATFAHPGALYTHTKLLHSSDS